MASIVNGRVSGTRRLYKKIVPSLFQNPPVEKVALVGSVRGLKKSIREKPPSNVFFTI